MAVGAIVGIASLASTAISAAGQAKASKQAASAQDLQADMHLRVASHNAGILLGRAGTSENNAEHAMYLGQFAYQQSRYEADINRRLARIEWDNSVKYATMRRQVGQSTAAAIHAKENETMAFAREDIRRAAVGGRALEGRQRAGYAAGGVDESGSALDVMAETAGRLELERLDILTKAHSRVQELWYAKKMAVVEAENEAAGVIYRAQVNKYMSNFQAMTTEQQGLVAAAEYLQTAKNYKAEAQDYREQADLALIEGQYAASGLQMQASATRTAGRYQAAASAVGAIGQGFQLVDSGAFSRGTSGTV